MNMWIVGQYITSTAEGPVWQFQGVFTEEAQAISACVSPDYFYYPVVPNEHIPDEAIEFPGCVYPFLEAIKS